MKSFYQYITESIVDPYHESYSDEVFDDSSTENPKLKTKILNLINKDLEQFKKTLNIKDVVLVGSILTKRYRFDTDLDVHILADGASEASMEKFAKDYSEHIIPGTDHPINYFIISNKKDHDRANALGDAEFDIEQNKFRRKPVDRPFDITQYFGDFKKKVDKINSLKADLRHDLIDYESLKKVDKSEVKKLSVLIKDELKKIENTASGLVDIYNKIRQDRKDAFAGEVTPDEIRKYGEKNRTPGNVIFKLMEKYHYLQFLKKIEEILGPDKKLSDKEAEKLAKVVKEDD